jgi:hypothetical protein
MALFPAVYRQTEDSLTCPGSMSAGEAKCQESIVSISNKVNRVSCSTVAVNDNWGNQSDERFMLMNQSLAIDFQRTAAAHNSRSAT